MTKEEVKDEIENILMIYSVNCFSIILLVHPEGKSAKQRIFPSNKTTLELGRKNDKALRVLEIEPLIVKFERENLNNQKYLIYPLMSSVTLIHDLIKKHNYNNTSPEFEFLRHIRNAFSHGNRFSLRNGEPKRLATFNKFKIEASLDGKPNVLIDYIKPGDLLDLIDFVKNNL
ncbi:MAG: hypothetical protein ACJ75J_02355 [Cytophagaceae bacterium]